MQVVVFSSYRCCRHLTSSSTFLPIFVFLTVVFLKLEYFFHSQKAAWKEGSVGVDIWSLEAAFHQKVTEVGGFMCPCPFSSLSWQLQGMFHMIPQKVPSVTQFQSPTMITRLKHTLLLTFSCYLTYPSYPLTPISWDPSQINYLPQALSWTLFQGNPSEGDVHQPPVPVFFFSILKNYPSIALLSVYTPWTFSVFPTAPSSENLTIHLLSCS